MTVDRTAELEERIARLEQVVDELDRKVRGTPMKILDAGPIRLDLVQRGATVAGVSLHLRPREFTLFAALARRIGEIVTNKELLKELEGGTAEPSYDAMKVHLFRLREKLDPSIARIVTHRGLGCALVLTEPPSE